MLDQMIMVIITTVMVLSVLAYMMNHLSEVINKRIDEVGNGISKVGVETEKAVAEIQEKVSEVKDSVVKVSQRTEVAVASIQRDFTAMTNTVQGDIAMAAGHFAMASNSARNLAEEAIPAAQNAAAISTWGVGCIMGYSITTVILAFVALFRNLYTRNKASRNNSNLTQVQRESLVLSERNVYAAFDAVALTILVPMLFTTGVTGAMKVWAFLKSVSRIVRDAAGVYGLYTRFMSTGSDDEFPATRVVDEIANATDELVNRVEAEKQARLNMDDEKKEEPTSLPPQPLYSSFAPGGRLSDEQMESIMKGEGRKYGNMCSQCNKVGCEHTNDPDYKGYFRIYEDDLVGKLREHWKEMEDMVHLNTIKEGLDKYPGLKVLVIFLMFGSLLLLARWYHSTPIKKEQIVSVQEEIERHQRRLKEIRERKEGNRGKRPAVDYSRSDKGLIKMFRELRDEDEMPDYLTVDGKGKLMHVDELGFKSYHVPNQRNTRVESVVVMTHKEWEELLLAEPYMKVMKKVKHNMPMREFESIDRELGSIVLYSIGNRMYQIDLTEAPYNHKLSNLEINQTEARKSRKTPVESPQVKENVTTFKKNLDRKLRCNFCQTARDAGDSTRCPWNHTQTTCRFYEVKKRQEIANEAWLKEYKVVPQTFKEALVNGPQFKTKQLQDSIGWAVVTSGGKTVSMNCTAMWTSVYVSGHIFAEGGDSITFEFKAGSYTCAKSSGRLLGNDSMFFPLPSFKVPQLRAGTYKIGDKCMLICRNCPVSQDDSLVVSQGVLREVITTENNERAYATYNSINGNCGAPVINSEGKVIGWHNANSGKDNMFIPVTPTLCRKVTSSESSF